MHEFSKGSDRAFILRPEASPWPWTAWSLIHAVVASSWIISGLPNYVKALIFAALAVHWAARRPHPPPVVIGSRAGPWALPELGLYNLRLSHRTIRANWWVLLRLQGGGVRERAVLLLVDQLPPGDWRDLQIALAETDWRSGDSS